MNENVKKLVEGKVPNLPNSLDYSMFSKYLLCPRYFFYKYIACLDCVGNSFPLDLVFGSAWHNGLEEGYLAMRDGVLDPEELTDLSIKAFNKKWESKLPKDFSDYDLNSFYPKTPGTAEDLLHMYWTRYDDTHRSLTIVEPEKKFYLPTGLGMPLIHGTIDLVYKDGQNILSVMEHKTTKSASRLWVDGFYNSFQVEMYSLAILIMEGVVPLVMVNAALFQKKSQDIFKFPVFKRQDVLHRFFLELQYNMQLLKQDTERLIKEVSSGDPIQTAFPRRQGSCMLYGRKCPYFDFCSCDLKPYQISDSLGVSFKISDIEIHYGGE